MIFILGIHIFPTVIQAVPTCDEIKSIFMGASSIVGVVEVNANETAKAVKAILLVVVGKLGSKLMTLPNPYNLFSCLDNFCSVSIVIFCVF